MTYRDDLQAARMRRDALARELRQVRSRMDEYQELARQEQALEREIAQTAQAIEQARARLDLPLLASVRVASPCKERWDHMTGDDHVRFCGRCEKNVYDLSSLTASQAEALLRERGESMCVRFFRRSDGTILTSDCPAGARKRFWRRTATAAVASGLAAAGITMAAATIDTRMGEMEPATLEQEDGEYFAGGMAEPGSPSMTDAERQRLEQAIRRAQDRLTEAQARPGTVGTAEELHAASWELESLRAELSRGQGQR